MDWADRAVLRRQVSRVRYQPGDRPWLSALSWVIPGAGRAMCSH
jgi:hypothetical protein